MKIWVNHGIKRPCSGYISFQLILIVDILFSLTIALTVNPRNMGGDLHITGLVLDIQHNVHEIKSGQQRIRQIDILVGGLCFVVSPVYWIGRSKN